MPKTQEFHVPYPRSQTFDALTRALPEARMKIKVADPANGHIDAATGMSFRSWGEKIQIDVAEAEGGSIVYVSSGNKAQLTSWGKNNENIENIQSALRRHLEGGQNY
jgi:glycerate kinase